MFSSFQKGARRKTSNILIPTPNMFWSTPVTFLNGLLNSRVAMETHHLGKTGPKTWSSYRDLNPNNPWLQGHGASQISHGEAFVTCRWKVVITRKEMTLGTVSTTNRVESRPVKVDPPSHSDSLPFRLSVRIVVWVFIDFGKGWRTHLHNLHRCFSFTLPFETSELTIKKCKLPPKWKSTGFL